MGPFPLAAWHAKFLIIVVDYFTKWVEAEPFTMITQARVTKFFKRDVIYRFGIPRILITNNKKQFECQPFREFCNELHIELRFTYVAHLQTNRMTEVINRTIV